MNGKKWLGILLAGMLATGAALADRDKPKDWRKTGSKEEKIENLIKTVPSTAQIMIEVGERYQNIYWAGKLGQWRFAEYQIDELEELIEVLQVASPKREKTAQVFLDHGLERFKPAIAERDWERFQKAFHHMRAACILCHEDNDHGYIVPPEQPVTAPSVILNLPQN